MKNRLGSTLGILVILGGCHRCPDPPDGIEIVPAAVVLGDPAVGTTFELEARLWKGSGAARRSIIPSDGNTLSWTSTPAWLERVGSSDFRATFRVKSDPGGSSGSVTVEADGRTSPAADILVPQTAIQNQDELTAVYSPAAPPAVGVVSGDWSVPGTQHCVSVVAFVKRAVLGQRVRPCGDLTSGWASVLAAGHLVPTALVTWTTPPAPSDVINAGPMQQPVLELPVALHIMVFDPGMTAAQLAAERTTVRATALIDLGIANDRLAEARAGIRLELAPANIQVGATMAEFSIADCVDADNPAKDLDVDGMLNVYYVDLVGTTSAFGSLRGTTCPWQEGRPEVIYVNRNDWVPSTLAHEVGHALGLTVPRDGHTEVMKEFDLTNLMMCCNVGQDRLARTRLTVGQVFRMNADSGSWLNWASPGGTPIRPGPRVACQCGRDDPAGLCPRLAEDVATPNTTPSQIHDRDCYDRLEFTSMPAGSETPVAIVAGRRWRMPPAKMGDLTNCRWVPGPSETLFGAVAVRFDNLTRPGKCPSWAAIFFDTHGPLFLELDEAVVRWTQSGDERRLGTLAPPPPRTVTVHLRYEQDDQDKVDDDKTHMLETFGEPNHVGIKLALTETSVANNVGVTCPPVTAPQELNLCYMDVGTTEGQWEGASRRITVWLNHRTPTSASHFVGQALGLSPLGPAELAAAPADGYEGNIMRSLPANRDKRLTLGQVYRINAALGVLAPCPANSMNCPVLHADVPR